jgi:hypothetical protein
MDTKNVLWCVVVILIVVFAVCYLRKKDLREGMGGGGFSALSGLNLYNRPSYNFTNPDDDGEYSTTIGRVVT